MELTGICKDAFDKWFELEYSSTYFWDYWYSDDNFPFSMAYGVYVDFFLANDIIIDLQPVLDYNEDTYTKVLYYSFNVIKLNFDPTFFNNDIEIKELSEARTEAIKKANEIFNNG